LRAGGVFAGVGVGLGRERSPGEIEIFAKISGGLFQDRVGPTFAALMGGAGIIIDAVEADAHIGIATMAGVASSWEHGQSPFPSAFVAMSGCSHCKYCIDFWRLGNVWNESF